MDGFAERFRGLLSPPVGNGREFFLPGFPQRRERNAVERERCAVDRDVPETNSHKTHLIIILKCEKIHVNRKRALREEDWMASPSASGVSLSSRSETAGIFFVLGRENVVQNYFRSRLQRFLAACGWSLYLSFEKMQEREAPVAILLAAGALFRTIFRRRRRCKNRDAFSSLSRPPRLWAPPRF